MKSYKHPAKDEITVAGLLRALSDPVRLSVVNCLARAGCEKACSTFDVPVHKSTMSHHLRILRETGIINIRSEGTFNYLSLRQEELDERFPGLLDSILFSMERETATQAGNSIDGSALV